MGQILFQKFSKSQKFDEILYSGITRFRNVKLVVFRQYQSTKTISKKKNMGQNRFKKLSKFQKFQLSDFTLTWPDTVRSDVIYSKELQQKKKMSEILVLRNI